MTGAKGRKKEPVDPLILQMVKVQILTGQEEVIKAQAALHMAEKVRDEAVRRGKNLGLSLRDIAPLMNLTVARVQQIAPEAGVEAQVPDEHPSP